MLNARKTIGRKVTSLAILLMQKVMSTGEQVSARSGARLSRAVAACYGRREH